MTPAPPAAPHLLALIRVLVRVVLERQLPIGLLDLLRGRAGLHPQDVIVLGFLHHLVSTGWGGRGGSARPRRPRGPRPAPPPPACASPSRSPPLPGLCPERAPGTHLRAWHSRTRAAGASAAGFYSAPAEGSARRRDATKTQNLRGGSGGSWARFSGQPGARALTRSPRMSAPPAGRPTPRSSSSDSRRGPWCGARARAL